VEAGAVGALSLGATDRDAALSVAGSFAGSGFVLALAGFGPDGVLGASVGATEMALAWGEGGGEAIRGRSRGSVPGNVTVGGVEGWAVSGDAVGGEGFTSSRQAVVADTVGSAGGEGIAPSSSGGGAASIRVASSSVWATSGGTAGDSSDSGLRAIGRGPTSLSSAGAAGLSFGWVGWRRRLRAWGVTSRSRGGRC
jgi:type IV secretion system protein VirB6/type IV secretion system protein TrbL